MKLFISICWIAVSFMQANEADKTIVAAFNKINSYPEIITYTNDRDINNSGGHIQGIQMVKNENGNYLLMTGSSDSYAYSCVVKNDHEPKVIVVNRLMDKPFKHAGGFQICKNMLAVGIEDNDEKDKSKVCIYDISDPERIAAAPMAVIDRKGKPRRNTAGCVAITEFNNKTLLAVGDWDTKHIDFYAGKINENFNDFSMLGSIDTEEMAKSGWSDGYWHPYQNINLFNIEGELYLIGLGQNQKAQDIVDLFRLTEDRPGNFELIKLASKTLNCTNECSFKAAAGAIYENGEFHIIASGYNVSETNVLNYFKP